MVTRCFHTEGLSGKSDQRQTQDTKDDQEQISGVSLVEQALWNACSSPLDLANSHPSLNIV
jgi:hypothetical protein